MQNQRLRYQSAKHKNVELAERCFVRGRQHHIKNQIDMAIKCYIEAIKNNKQHYRSFCNLGGIYRFIGNYQEAISKYHRALRIKNDDYKTLYNLANLYRIIGYTEKAIKTYLVIIKATPDREIQLNTYNNLGICYKNTYQYEEAIKCYQNVMKLNPLDEAGYYNLAFCLNLMIKSTSKQTLAMVRQKRIKQARDMFNKSLQINSNNWMAKVCLIQLKYLQDQSESVLKQCIKEYQAISILTSINDLVRIQINRNIAYCKNLLERTLLPKQPQKILTINKSKQNIKSTTNIIQQNHKSQQFLSHQQQLIQLFNQQKYKQAIKIIQQIKYSILKVEFQTLLYSKAAFYYSNLDYANAAIRCFYLGIKNYNGNNYQSINIDSSDSKVEVLNAVGDAFTLLGEHQLAIKFYKISSSISSNAKQNIKAHCGLGYNYQKLDLINEAEQCFRKQIQIDPNNSSGYIDLATCLHQRHKLEQALFYYNKYLQVANKTNQSINIQNCHYFMAKCYKQLGNQQKQLQCLERLMRSYEEHYDSLEDMCNAYRNNSTSLTVVYNHLASIYQKIIQVNPSNKKQTTIKLLALYKVMICLDGNNKKLYLDIGCLLYELEKYQQALQNYQCFLQTANYKNEWLEMNNCMSNMSLCYKKLKKIDKQIEILEKLMKSYEKSYESLVDMFKDYKPQQLIKVYLQLAQIYQQTLKNQQQFNKKHQFKEKLKILYQTILLFPNCLDYIKQKLENLDQLKQPLKSHLSYSTLDNK